MTEPAGAVKRFGTLEEIPAELPIAADSREDVTNKVFCCIRGRHHDGHRDAEDVLARGAAALVTERPLGLPRELTVPDTRAACAVLAARHYGNPAGKMRLIGITGTNGKTTAAHMLGFLLEQSGRRVGLIGTNGIRFGGKTVFTGGTTPEPVLLHRMLKEMLEAGITDVVMEVSSQALDQRRCEGLQFEAAVFLGLSPEHLDYHGDMESYYEAKKRLFRRCRLAVICREDPYGRRLLRECGGQQAGFSAPQVLSLQAGESRGLWRGGILTIPFTGAFALLDAAAAAETAFLLGLSPEEIRAAFPRCPAIAGRQELLYRGCGRLILRDYAHTPDALGKMLSVLRKIHFGRIIVLFGCGGDRDREKRPLMGRRAAELADRVILTNDNPRSEPFEKILLEVMAGFPPGTDFSVIPDRKSAIASAVRALREGDLLLLAGKGHETVQIFRDRTVPFDEKKIVKEILESENIPWKK